MQRRGMPKTGHRCSKFSPANPISRVLCEHYLLAYRPRTGRNLLDVESSVLWHAGVLWSSAVTLITKYLSSLAVLAIEVTFFFSPGPGMGHLTVWWLAAPGSQYCHDPGGCTESNSLLHCQSRHTVNTSWGKDYYFFPPYKYQKKLEEHRKHSVFINLT